MIPGGIIWVLIFSQIKSICPNYYWNDKFNAGCQDKIRVCNLRPGNPNPGNPRPLSNTCFHIVIRVYRHIHFLSKIFFMIKWTERLFYFDVAICISVLFCFDLSLCILFTSFVLSLRIFFTHLCPSFYPYTPENIRKRFTRTKHVLKTRTSSVPFAFCSVFICYRLGHFTLTNTIMYSLLKGLVNGHFQVGQVCLSKYHIGLQLY